MTGLEIDKCLKQLRPEHREEFLRRVNDCYKVADGVIVDIGDNPDELETALRILQHDLTWVQVEHYYPTDDPEALTKFLNEKK